MSKAAGNRKVLARSSNLLQSAIVPSGEQLTLYQWHHRGPGPTASLAAPSACESFGLFRFPNARGDLQCLLNGASRRIPQLFDTCGVVLPSKRGSSRNWPPTSFACKKGTSAHFSAFSRMCHAAALVTYARGCAAQGYPWRRLLPPPPPRAPAPEPHAPACRPPPGA